MEVGGGAGRWSWEVDGGWGAMDVATRGGTGDREETSKGGHSTLSITQFRDRPALYHRGVTAAPGIMEGMGFPDPLTKSQEPLCPGARTGAFGRAGDTQSTVRRVGGVCDGCGYTARDKACARAARCAVWMAVGTFAEGRMDGCGNIR